MRTVVALVLLALAGCIAAPDGLPPAPAAQRIPLDLPTCEVLELLVDVDAARARQYVPEGFAVVETNGAVRTVFGAMRCGDDSGSRAFVAIAVEPTDPRLRDAGVARHYWEPEHAIADDDAFAVALARLNATAHRARVDVSPGPPFPAALVRGDGWTHGLEGQGGAPPVGGPAPVVGGVFREWFPAEGGYAYLQASFGESPVGAFTGVLRAGEGTVTRALLGAETAPSPGVALAGVRYVDAEVGFVPFAG